MAEQDTPRGQLTSSVANFITNFYAHNTCFVEASPRQLPVFVCNASGLANTRYSSILTLRSSDKAHTVLNSGVVDRLPVRDFTARVLLSRQISGAGQGQQGGDRVPCRVWGLYHSDKMRQQHTASTGRVLCHSTSTEWRLLATEEADSHASDDRTLATTDMYSLCGDGRESSEQCLLGLMVECLNAAQQWPSDAVVPLVYALPSTLTSEGTVHVHSNGHSYGAPESTIVTSDSPNEACLSSAASADGSTSASRLTTPRNEPPPSVYSIGQAVDVLADSGCFAPGEVVSIARDRVPSGLGTGGHTVMMLVTVRLLAAAVADTPSSVTTDTKSDVVILPYYSPRILPRGSVTGLYCGNESIESNQRSVLAGALLCLSALVAASDAYAHSANLLPQNQSVAVTRIVLPRPVAKPAQALPRKTPVADQSASSAAGALSSASRASSSSANNNRDGDDDGSSSDGEEGGGDDEWGESVNGNEGENAAAVGAGSKTLSKDNSHSSLQSKQSSCANGENKRSAAVGSSSSSSSGSANGGATAAKSGYFSHSRSGTVVPLPFEEDTPDAAAVDSIVPANDAAAGCESEVSSSDVDAKLSDMAAVPEEVATVTADLAALRSIIVNGGERCPPCVRLLYDIVFSEQLFVTNKSTAVRVVETDPFVFGSLRPQMRGPCGMAVLEDADLFGGSSDLIQARNMDTDRSITESGQSADTANTADTENGTGAGGPSRNAGRRLGLSFHARAISKACNSLSRGVIGKRSSEHSSGKRTATKDGNLNHSKNNYRGANAAELYKNTNGQTNTAAIELSSIISSKGENSTSSVLANGSAVTVQKNAPSVANTVTSASNRLTATSIGLTGLNNLGNTCFLSSALQCLTKTPVFVLYFLTQQYVHDLNHANVLGSKGRVTEEFARFLFTIYNLNQTAPAGGSQHSSEGMSLFHKSSNSYASKRPTSQAANTNAVASNSVKYDSMSPTALLRAFQQHKPYFTGADQQDAQEFLSELLDTFHEDLKAPPPAADKLRGDPPAATTPTVATGNSDSPRTDGSSGPTAAASRIVSVKQILEQGDAAWAQHSALNSSVVSSVFQGQMCSKVTCKLCSTVSVKFEPFTTLSLSIPKMKGVGSGAGPGGVADNVTVIATVYRKMPRLLQVRRYEKLCQDVNADVRAGGAAAEEGEGGLVDTMDWAALLQYYG